MAAAADSAEETVIAIAAVEAEIAPISTQESKYTYTPLNERIFTYFNYRIVGSAAAAATGTGDREATNLWSDATNRRQLRRQEDRSRFRSKAQGKATVTARKEERRYSC